ncbi:YrzE family protein [Nocardioides sp. MH1]|uniref:YrzE family protein n=1 Tax=Nocardioides sp. MH1 TaxID=3242490 RepID=UPI00351F9E84
MELHESLAELARDHGASLFNDADAFRGALDDYLDEGSASTGTINLLTDAVRLGALQGMLTMLDSGASVDDAVESAGQRLSRDRGSADVAGSQWACAVLGYALGRVPVDLATRLRPDALTREPPRHTAPRPTDYDDDATSIAPPGQPLPPVSPPVSPPASSPAGSPPPPPVSAPVSSPVQQWPAPSQPSQQPTSYGTPPGGVAPYASTQGVGYGAPPSKRSGRGILIGAIVGVVLFGVIAVVAIIALSSGGDDTPSADDTTSPSVTTSDSNSSTPVTTDPALTLKGSGYSYQFPNSDWKDITSGTADDTGTIDTISAPGSSISNARGNILVEESSAYGETDVNQLTSDWKDVLSQSTGATPTDIGTRDIGGKTAVGVELKWTNGNNFDVHQVAYLVVSGDNQYSITASFRQGDDGFRATFESVLDTWHWDE